MAKNVAAETTKTTPELANKVHDGANVQQRKQAIVHDVEHLATFSTGSNRTKGARTKRTNNSDNNEDGNDDDDEHDSTSGAHQNNDIKSNNESDQDVGSTRNGLEICDDVQEPRVALQRLFELEKLSGIWTQRMQIELQEEVMLIVDCETNSIVERFKKDQVTKPEAFNEYNDIYNNIIVFIIINNPQSDNNQAHDGGVNQKQHQPPQPLECHAGELHIFQCVSHKAQQLVNNILNWKQGVKNLNTEEVSSSFETTKTVSGIKSSPSMVSKNNSSDKKASPMSLCSSSSSSSGSSSNEPNKKSSQDNKLKQNGPEQNKQTNSKPADGSSLLANGGKTGKVPVVVTAAAINGTSADSAPIVNVNVKETVQVFNQIAALREKSMPSSPTSNHVRPLSDSSIGSASNSTSAATAANGNGQLSQGVHLYKQRSIRATLAPEASKQPESSRSITASAAGHSGQQQQQQHSSLSSSSQQSAPPTRQITATTNNAQPVVSSEPAAHKSEPSACSIAQHRRSATCNETDSPPELLFDESEAQQQQRLSRPKGTRHNNNNNNHHHHQHSRQQQQLSGAASDKTSSSSSSGSRAPRAPRNNSPPPPAAQQQRLADQVATNESYVSVLNHCFDDIEKFIIRLQQAYNASRELQQQKQLRRTAAQSHSSASQTKRSSAAAGHSASSSSASSGSSSSPLASGGGGGGGKQQPLPPIPSGPSQAELIQRARGPTSDDYFEILSKFKLAFNLLAKLKGCIHEPNAPELVHFLFTPLAIIIESARNVSPCVDPTLVGIPYLNRDALELLSNCCTSKESDLWLSLGSNWTQTIDMSLLDSTRLPSSFQPIFSDGWAPVINELELIGLPSSATSSLLFDNAASAPIVQSDRRSAALQRADTTGACRPAVGQQQLANNSRRRVSSSQVAAGQAFGGAYDERALLAGPGHTRLRRAGRASSPCQKSNNNSHYRSHTALDTGSASANNLPHHHHHSSSYGQFLDDYTEPLAYEQQQQLLEPAQAITRAPKTTRQHDQLLAARHYRSTEQVSSSMQTAPQRSAHAYARGPASAVLAPLDSQQHAMRSRRAQAIAGKMPPASCYEPNEHYLTDHHAIMTTCADEASPFMLAPNDDASLLAEREAMLLDLGPAQIEWFYELQARDAIIVRVLFTREANNDKELSVRRGELLEILDNSRKWWKARNIDLQVAHVPHTIVAIMDHYQTLDELLTNTSSSDMLTMHSDESIPMRHQFHNVPANNVRSVASRRNDLVASGGPMMMVPNTLDQYGLAHDERRAAKAAGGFRYF